MSTFRRLLGTAQKALDSASHGSASSGRGSAPSGRGSDWRTLVRDAAHTLTGESRPTSHGSSPDRDRQQSEQHPFLPTKAFPVPLDDARHTGNTGSGTAGSGAAGPGDGSSGAAPGNAAAGNAAATGAAADAGLSAEDRRAIARYDYLVRTAEPDQLERVHREAFEKLTPAQRTQLTASLRSELPQGERPRTDAPQDLARSATRLGAFDPRRLTGLLSRSGRDGRGLGTAAKGAGAVGAGVLGAGAVGGLLAAVAGGAVVTAVGGSLLEQAVGEGIDVDALAPDLAGDLGDVGTLTSSFEQIEGMEGLGGLDHVEGFDGLNGATEGLGDTVSGAGDRLSGLGDQLSDLGLGDIFGR